MTSKKVVGIDRKLKLEWLDATAAKVADGIPVVDLREYLRDLLGEELSGRSFNSDLGKTITVLCHIWSTVPGHAVGLRDRAVVLLPRLDETNRMAVHWAMMIGTYPFALSAAETVGKLISLQDEFSIALLRRRLIDGWGDRAIVRNSAQRLVRTMVQWGVIMEANVRGTYKGVPRKMELSEEVEYVLLEALLAGSPKQEMQVSQLVNHAAAFPFILSINAHKIRRAKQFRVFRQGLDIDFIERSEN
jgi:hypothetical protein